MSVQESKKHILIIGAGIIGLQCALTLLEEGHDKYRVSIVAEYMPGDDPGIYASAWAGAQWRSHESSYTEAAEWDIQSYRYWEDMIERGEIDCGIASIKAVRGKNYWAALKATAAEPSTTTEQTKDSPDPWWSNYVKSYSRIEQSKLPINTAFGVSFDTFTIDVQKYMIYIQRRIEKLGGNLTRARLPSDQGLRGAVAAAKSTLKLSGEENFYAVIVAAGIHAGNLVGDKNLYPIRGQTIRVNGVAESCITRLGLDEKDRIAVMPRPGAGVTIIGVTVEPGIESTEVDQARISELLAAAKPYCPELLNEQGEFDIHDVGVGIRPGRKGGPRVELEQVDDLTVIHAYGVAGGGYQNSIGLARKVLGLLQEHNY